MVGRLIAAAAMLFACGAAQAGSSGKAALPSQGWTDAAAERIEIPFVPPLDRPLRYILERHEPRGGRDSGFRIGVDLHFAREGEGYRLTVIHRLPPSAVSDPAAALLLKPMLFRLDKDGVLLSMVDEDAYWSASRATFAEVEKREKKPGLGEIADAMLARMRALPERERLALLATNFAPALDMAGASLPRRGSLTTREERETLFGRFDQSVEYRVDQVGEDRLRIVSTTRMPPERLLEAMKNLASQVAPDKPVPAVRFTGYEERSSYEVSLRTGLVTSWKAERILESEEGGVKQRAVATRSLTEAPPTLQVK